MKATLTFDLPEEREDYHTATHATDYRAVLSNTDEWARQCVKYGHTFKSVEEALDELRKRIHDDLDGLPL